jgi:hypothetical protein
LGCGWGGEGVKWSRRQEGERRGGGEEGRSGEGIGSKEELKGMKG